VPEGTRSPDVPDTYLTGWKDVLAVTDVTNGLWKTRGLMNAPSQTALNSPRRKCYRVE
jgi:hypothetical protein